MPAATLWTETDTPFNSTGRDGAKRDSDAKPLPTAADDGARLPLEVITLSSPAANPGAIKGTAAGLPLGLGLGLGLGDGEGLPLGLAVGDGDATGTRLAP